MKFLKAISIALFASALTAMAAPRFALVRVRDIYSSLPSTTALEEQIKNDRLQIMRDQRADKLRNIISELQVLQGQLSDKGTPLDEASRKALARTYELRRQEALTLQQDFEGFQSQQEKLINQRMVAGMRKALTEIVEISMKVAKERGYDSVFDSSGNTNTGVPFILYSKNAPDITGDIQAVMNDRETAMTADRPENSAAR